VSLSNHEAMRAAVFANPEDLATLQVYIDSLLEAGDPLGEAMRIASAELVPRLARPDEDFLAGRLAPVLSDFTVFRTAVLAVTLKRLSPRAYRRVTGQAEWASVRSIHFARGKTARTQSLPVDEVAALISHPVMTSLKQLSGFDLRVLQAVGIGPTELPLDTIHLRYTATEQFPQGELPALPHVRHLSLDGFSLEYLPAMIRSPFMTQLRVFEAVNAYGPPLAHTLIGPGTANTRLELFHVGAWQGVREKTGWSLRIEAPGITLLDVCEQLSGPVQRIQRLALITPPLSEALRRQTCDLARVNGWELHLEESLYGSDTTPLDEDIPF
jgi:hypothetical protein